MSEADNVVWLRCVERRDPRWVKAARALAFIMLPCLSSVGVELLSDAAAEWILAGRRVKIVALSSP